MSTITDELIDTQLPDKTSGKYKPKRLRTLLKALTAQIMQETIAQNVHRISFAVFLSPGQGPVTSLQVAGTDCFLKKVVLQIYNYNGNPIPAGDEISISFGDTLFYSGPVMPSISIPGSNQITFTELDNIKIQFELKGTNSYSFNGAIFIGEL